MADALVAALLAGQRKRRDPFEGQRLYGQRIMQQGASTAPVQSWGEGLARALQGGIGGFFAGQADRRQDERDKRTLSTMGDLVASKTPEELSAKIAALKESPDIDADVLTPFMGQVLSQRMADDRKAALGQRGYQAAGGTMPMTINMTKPGVSTAPLPAPGAAAPGNPGGFANNTGNLRASNASWPGKGQPHNGFETFATPQAGVNAHFANLQTYAKQNPNMTVAEAIAKWAPPTENDTQTYISQVAEATGINPGMPLVQVLQDPAVGAMLLDAMTRKEKGGLPPGVNADTFMSATGGQQAPPQVAQGSAPADASGTPLQPQKPTHDAGAEFEALGQRAAQAGNYELATQYQMKANEARAAFGTKQFEEEQKRGAEGVEHDRRKAFDNTSKLRGDFEGTQQVKDYRKARAVFKSAVDALGTNSAAADLNLVYAFATMMDPGSVVREGEMGMVTATQGASDRVKALVNMVSGGQRISPDARRALVDEMASRYQAYKTAHDEIGKSYGAIATRGGYLPEDVVIPLPEVKYEREAPKAAGGPKPGDIVDGWRFKGGDPSRQENWEQVQ